MGRFRGFTKHHSSHHTSWIVPLLKFATFLSFLLCLSMEGLGGRTMLLPCCDAKSINNASSTGMLMEENPNYRRVGNNKKRKRNKKKNTGAVTSTSEPEKVNIQSKKKNQLKKKKQVAATTATFVETKKKKKDEDESDDDSDSSDSDEYDEEYDDESEDDEEDGLSVKSRVSKALSIMKSNSTAAVVFRKYRAPVTVALVLIAFRSEISSVLYRIITEPVGNDGTRRMKRLSPTSILKIVLFLDFMMKCISLTGGNSNGASSTGSDGVRKWLEEAFSVATKSRYKNPTFVPPTEQHYTFERMNERYVQDQLAFYKAFQSAPYNRDPAPVGGRSLFEKSSSSSLSLPKVPKNLTTAATYNSTSIILELKKLDSGVSEMESLRDKVSFLLSQHRANVEIKKYQQLLSTDNGNNNITNSTNANSASNVIHAEMEVVVLLESPGGSASDYGLAAEQLGRLTREPGINVTVCVDKVAASGGYMMAVMATPGRLYAAPLSIVGSIGVIGQAVNIHNALTNYGIRPLVFRGGKDKAPVGMIGEVTKEGVAKVQEMVDKTHAAFKRHIIQARPHLTNDIDTLATGDVWLGSDALHVGLVDRIISSDEYLDQRMQEGARVLRLKIHTKPRFPLFGAGKSGPGLPRMMSNIHTKMQNLNSAADDIFSLIHKFKRFVEETNINIPDESNYYDPASTTILAKAMEISSVQGRKF